MMGTFARTDESSDICAVNFRLATGDLGGGEMTMSGGATSNETDAGRISLRSIGRRKRACASSGKLNRFPLSEVERGEW